VALQILIVDDSETARRITRTILRSRHWTVCGEANGGCLASRNSSNLSLKWFCWTCQCIDGIEAANALYSDWVRSVHS
jgi:hypothetical protein